MGSTYIQGFLDEKIDIKQAMVIHLTGNHYPPVPLSMVQVCIDAVYKGIQGLWNDTLPLPDGITWREKPDAPVWSIVEAHHLDCFITQYGDNPDDYEDEDEDELLTNGRNHVII